VVGFVGALVLEHSAVKTEDSAEATSSPTQGLSLWHDANERRYVATALGAVSLGGAGVAVWMYLHDRRRPADRSAAWSPALVGHGAGLAVAGTWR
jgi:hypothetical protein